MPKPFLKWPGGKRALLASLLERVPKSFNRYLEPFLGGGALFWALEPPCAVLSDIDDELINAYHQVKTQPEKLITALAATKNNEEAYYQIRAWDRSPDYNKRSATERACRIIYISRAGYNGLMRRNRAGQINVAYGHTEGALPFDFDNIRACHDALGRKITLQTSCYAQAIKTAKAGDFVYLDPPYYGLFTQYNSNGFNSAYYLSLRGACELLDLRGAKFMLSHSASEEMAGLFRNFNIEKVQTFYTIGQKKVRGKRDKEVIIRNYN